MGISYEIKVNYSDVVPEKRGRLNVPLLFYFLYSYQIN